MQTIYKSVQVGIYDNCTYVARIYADKIIVTTPYVKWLGNTGGYAESKEKITHPEILSAVALALRDDADTTAWQAIGQYLQDDYLCHAR